MKEYIGKLAHLRQQCHNSKCVIFQERILKVLKCYNFLCVQRRHNCSSAASFANCVMTLYLLKVHLETFLSIPITQKCQILSCDTLVYQWATWLTADRQDGMLLKWPVESLSIFKDCDVIHMPSCLCPAEREINCFSCTWSSVEEIGHVECRCLHSCAASQ